MMIGLTIALLVIVLAVVYALYRAGRRLGEKEIEARALKEANKALDEAHKKYAKITQETLHAVDDGEQLMCDILRPKP